MAYDDEHAELLAELRAQQNIAQEHRAEEAEAATKRVSRTETGAVIVSDRESREDIDKLHELWDRHDGRTVEGDHVDRRITRHRDGRVSLEP